MRFVSIVFAVVAFVFALAHGFGAFVDDLARQLLAACGV